ncbi:MAG: hypothetical protein AAB919_04110 [Patescibacteria group bacterium]
MKLPSQRFLLAFFFALAALGFLLPFWPLSVVGILLAAGWGRWFAALLIGLLLDLAWGAPLGLTHFLYFPFTLSAVVAALIRLWIARYLLDRAPQERL